MTIRLGIAATAAGAVLVGLAAAVSSLLAALAHPLSLIAAARIGDLFATLPFLFLGIAGLVVCTDALPPRLRIPLAVGWAALMAGLCLTGPLAGPYAWLFEHAVGRPAAQWQTAWTSIVAWNGPRGLVVDLGLARWPILAGAVATAGIGIVGWAASVSLPDRLSAYRHAIHVPHWHAPRSVLP